MNIKKYKLILNIGYKNETIIYFDRLTKKIKEELENTYSCVLLYYDEFFKKYMLFDSKINEYQKALFNSNFEYYCGKGSCNHE